MFLSNGRRPIRTQRFQLYFGRMFLLRPASFAALSAALLACNEPRTLIFATDEIVMTAEGPLYAGTNTAQGEWVSQLDAFLAENGMVASDVSGGHLVGAVLSTCDSSGFDGVNGISLQLASDQVSMQELAVLAPLPAGKRSIELSLATQQDRILDFLQQPQMTVVADVDLQNDQEADLTMNAQLTFELDVKN